MMIFACTIVYKYDVYVYSIYICKILSFFFRSLLSGGQGFFSHFRPRGKPACHRYNMDMSGYRPSSVAVLGSLNVADLSLFGKGLRSASLRRAGHLEHPKLFYNFFIF